MYDTASRLVRCGPISLHLTHTGSLPRTSLGGALEVRSGGVGASPPLKSSAPFCLGTPRRPGPTYGGACCTGCEATECGLHRCRSRTGSASPARDRSRGSIYLSVYQSIHLSICPSNHPTIQLPTTIRPSNYLYLSIHHLLVLQLFEDLAGRLVPDLRDPHRDLQMIGTK